MTIVGHHLLAEYRGVGAALLDDVAALESALVDAAIAAGARVLDRRFHRFEGGGVSGLLLLAESHVSIHTWPALGRAAVDVYTCGDTSPWRAHEVLLARLRSTSAEVMVLRRGERIEMLPAEPTLVIDHDVCIDRLALRHADGQLVPTGLVARQSFPGDPPIAEAIEAHYFREASLVRFGDALWITVRGGTDSHQGRAQGDEGWYAPTASGYEPRSGPPSLDGRVLCRVAT